MPLWVVSVLVPIVIKLIDIIPQMLTRKHEIKRIKRIKHKMKNRVLILSGKPTIEEIADAGKAQS
jgi:hypothetical protein